MATTAKPRRKGKPAAKRTRKAVQRPCPSAPSLETTLRLIPNYDPWADPAGCRLDEEAARRALSFFPECLQLIEDGIRCKAGDPFNLEPWQQAIVGNLFGWKRPDGTRRYRKAIIFVPGKNGKTPLAAGTSVYAFGCLGEKGSKVALLAYTREQAGLVWSWARGFVERDATLGSYVEVYQHELRLKNDPGASYKPIAGEAKTIHGLNLNAAVADEIHTFDDPDTLNTLKTRFASRRDPLLVEISTAGWDRTSIGYSEYRYAKGIIEGKIKDPYTLPVIYEADASDDWTSEATWAKANPNLGVSINIEQLRAVCKEAQESPDLENHFKRVHLNIWTESAKRFYAMELWDRPGNAKPLDLDALEGRPCYAGLDMADKRDLTGLTLVFKDDDGGYTALPFAWIPQNGLDAKERRDNAQYVRWAQDGLLTPTPGDVIDHAQVKRDIGEILKRYDVLELAFDPTKATQITTQLAEEFGVSLVSVAQQPRYLNEPMKLTLELLKADKLRHGGNPMLRWQANNTSTITDRDGRIRPVKGQEKGRIDNISGLVTALSRAILAKDFGFVYDRRGVRSL